MIFILYNYLKIFNSEVLFMSNEVEIWKTIGVFLGIDYTGMYEASTFGHVRSIDRTITNKNGVKVKRKGQLLTEIPRNGYLEVVLTKDNVHHSENIHQLIMNAHCPNPNPEIYTEINHIDEDKTNNRLDNLEWCTHKENVNHGTSRERARNSLRTTPYVGQVKQMDLDGNVVKIWKSANKAAKELGINNSNLYRHLRGINKTCGGYRWEYVNK